MPDPRHDPARLTEHARQLRTLADQGRAALNKDTLERNTRLGQQRDQAVREAKATDQAAQTAEAQTKKELAAAEAADKAAAALEQRAAKELDPEIREAAAEQRILAESHRQRAHRADAEAESLGTRMMEQRVVVEDLEKQIAAETARRAKLDAEVDKLEDHAAEAKAIADIGDEVARLEARLATAEGQGDDVVAGRLRNQITEARKTMDTFHDDRAKAPQPDAQVMTDLGVSVPGGVFDVPSAPLAPTPPGAPLPDDLAGLEHPPGTAGDQTPGDDATAIAAMDAPTGEGSLEDLVMPSAGDPRAQDSVVASAAAIAAATASGTLTDPFAPDVGDVGFTPPVGGDERGLGDPGFTPPGGDDRGGLGDPGFTPPEVGLDPGLDLPGVGDPGFTPPGSDGGGLGDPGFTPPVSDDGTGLGDPGFTPPGGGSAGDDVGSGFGDPGFTPPGGDGGFGSGFGDQGLGAGDLGAGFASGFEEPAAFDSVAADDGGGGSFDAPADDGFSDVG